MDAAEKRNQTLIICVASILLSICFITFGLRLWARKMARVRLGPDDWSMIVVLLVCTAMSTSDFVGVRFGSGAHAYNLPESDVYQFQINLYAFMLLWTAGTTSVRVSILLFYWRVFSVPTFRKAVLVAGGIVLSAGTAFLLIFAFQCSPPSHFWNTATDGTCIDQLAFYLSGGAINLLQDVMILIMPMPVLWHLKATVPRKLALCFIFALGGFVCITSIIRLFTIKQIDPTDFTWSNVNGGVWSTIEVEVGCICANLVHLRPLFSRYWGGLRPKSPSNGDISLEAGWSNRRAEGFEEIAGSPALPVAAAFDFSSESELGGKDGEGIVVSTELSQESENRLPTEHGLQGHLTTNVYGLN